MLKDRWNVDCLDLDPLFKVQFIAAIVCCLIISLLGVWKLTEIVWWFVR